MYCTGRRESSQKQPHRESGRRAQLFPQLVWVYTVDSACPLASALTPCTFRCNGAQSKSLTRAHGDGGGMGEAQGRGIPFLASQSVLWSRPQGAGVAPGEERGPYKYFVFTNGSFQTPHFPGSAHLSWEPLGGSTGLTGRTKAMTATVVFGVSS